ncbi:MAG: DUF3791 domain-containing protein [Treponema sp.]|jgi:hypothetical protein|nr:DUF3791 domain-containing protein [Treponema sp.]
MKTNIKNDFLIYVIEEYKYLENINADALMQLFTKYNIFDYIIKHYDALHTLGGRAIADDINLFVERKQLAHNRI